MNKDNVLEFLEECLNNNSCNFEGNIKNLISEHKRNSNRLYTIIKQSDRQQKVLLKLNEQLDLYKNNLELKVEEEIEKREEKEAMLLHQSKMASMGEMIENIAHQWKQPLSVISIASADIQLDNVMNEFENDGISTNIENINDSVKHLSQTINDFRDFFNTKKKKNIFTINNAFEKTIKLISSQFRTENIIIEQNIKEVSILGLENELIQVLINILNNARDALVEKKEEEKKLILIDLIIKDNHLEIYIKDNAGGISNDIIDKIFEAHFTTKDNSGGTGIGLYMSKMIIEKNMNGTIEANNIEFLYDDISYVGVQFIIKIPYNPNDL